MAQVIVFPRGQLTELDRARMEEAGIVAVEADDPSAVVTVIPGAPLATSDDLALAALVAVTNTRYETVGADFARNLLARLQMRERHQADQNKGSGNG